VPKRLASVESRWYRQPLDGTQGLITGWKLSASLWYVAATRCCCWWCWRKTLHVGTGMGCMLPPAEWGSADFMYRLRRTERAPAGAREGLPRSGENHIFIAAFCSLVVCLGVTWWTVQCPLHFTDYARVKPCCYLVVHHPDQRNRELSNLLAGRDRWFLETTMWTTSRSDTLYSWLGRRSRRMWLALCIAQKPPCFLRSSDERRIRDEITVWPS